MSFFKLQRADDLPDITEPFKDIGEDIRDISRELRNYKDKNKELVNEFAEMVASKATKIVAISYEGLIETFNKNLKAYSEKIETINELINSKEYDPQITIETKEFTEEVERLYLGIGILIEKAKKEIKEQDIQGLEKRLLEYIKNKFNELSDELRKKKTFVFTIERDKNELIKTATATQT